MFGRDEKLKRLEVENRLSEALEKLASAKADKERLLAELGRMSHVEATNKGLREKVEELTGKPREQSEADLVLASLRVIKAVVFDEKKKEDPYYQSLMAQQQSAMMRAQSFGGLAAGFGSMVQAISGLR